jgi:arylsulfatase A-like enzyme/Tfp pilus assembly protein PilF
VTPRPPLAVLAVAAALLAAACRPSRSPAPPSSVVLITIDTLRADHVNATLTPSLDTLERDAVVFDQAITVAPLTLPAHASLLTGLYPTRHGVRDNEVFTLAADVPTYPELLKQRGYATAAFVSAVVLDHRYGLNRGFDVYDDAIDGPERTAVETVTRATEWLDRAPRPFFVWVHIFEPHAPYRSGSYGGDVSAADAAAGRLFKYLHDAGSWDDIVLSVTADHGESLGEHREQTHGFFLYEAALRIPWILKAPGLKPRRVPRLVRLADEMPTIVELATRMRGEAPGPASDGVSVASSLAGTGWLDVGEAYSETFLPRDQFGWSPLASVRTERFKYIAAPQPELYDVVADPAESMNIAATQPAEAARLKRVVGAVSRAPASPSLRRAPDPALANKLMSLGYVGYSPPTGDTNDARLADPKDKIGVYSLTMTALEKSEAGSLDAALEDVEKARRIDPNVAQVEFLRGTLLGQLGRFDAAAAALERTVALNPRYTAARFKLALALLRLSRPERAADALNEVVRQEPDDFRAWHNLAAIAYSRGDLDRAEALERKAVALSPEYAEAWNTLGAIALVRKQTDVALEALSKATTLAPKNAQAFGNLSLAFAAAGQRDRARSAAARACTLDPRYCSTPADARR